MIFVVYISPLSIRRCSLPVKWTRVVQLVRLRVCEVSRYCLRLLHVPKEKWFACTYRYQFQKLFNRLGFLTCRTTIGDVIVCCSLVGRFTILRVLVQRPGWSCISEWALELLCSLSTKRVSYVLWTSNLHVNGYKNIYLKIYTSDFGVLDNVRRTIYVYFRNEALLALQNESCVRIRHFGVRWKAS